ncbi:MAG TPA: dockerin type I repeat-containing protein, partial [Candidatus Marinimicrobia bacterium]|nr:dockerin type I repeat-containing protein [Candidatus Neomarinimicrobiota bacterium]
DTAYGAWWDTASHGLTHWQVNWDEGGSEGGSSGSPIFNERFQIVGVLTGGAGECGEGWPDLYGKFYYGWNWEMDQNRRMIDWLDPDYTGTLVIDGTYVEVTGLTGDLNSDDAVNILDIIQLANMILSDEYADNADLNGDGTLNILDIISLANIILGS